jgi:HK97 family phage portal protein
VRIFGLDITRAKREKRADLAAVPSRSGWWPLIRDWYPGAWQNNDELSVESQLAYYAVYACVTLIAGDMAKLRQRLVEKVDGIWVETTSPAFSPVLRKPNRFQNHIQFKQWWAMSKLTRGNTYALKQRDQRGIVVAEYILDPSLVTPLVAPDGAVYYQLNADNLAGVREQVVVPASEIIHDRMNCLFHPLVGVSPLFACGLAAAQGLSIQEQSRTFFGNGARPSGVLTAPGAISQETADRLQTAWQEKFAGGNSGRVAVLGDGLKYEPMVMTATDAQLIEQLKMTAEMVCAAFHVPPFKVAIGQMPTYQNGELLNQAYYDNCLQLAIEEYELAQDEGLGIGEGVRTAEGRELGVELDLRGLLRMDTATQVKTLAEAVTGKLLTVDEARAEMERGKVPGGDKILAQVQYVPLDKLGEEPAPEPEPVPDDEDEDVTDEEMDEAIADEA